MTAEATIKPWGAVWGGVEAEWPNTGQVAGRQMERDAALVEQCLQGGDNAWEQLVRSHTGLVYGACFRFTGRADDARDLTQEVFLRVFRSLHTYDAASGGFRTWLVRLTRNLLIDHYRKTRKHQVLDPIEDQMGRLEETHGLGARADQTLAGREAGELLQVALQKLSPELREAVVLRDLQEMEYREIAGVLSVPEGTVKSRINRGRRELARHLRAAGVTP
jgi:RNA polymerase sigma-70 factor (ECF subfamily)